MCRWVWLRVWKLGRIQHFFSVCKKCPTSHKLQKLGKSEASVKTGEQIDAWNLISKFSTGRGQDVCRLIFFCRLEIRRKFEEKISMSGCWIDSAWRVWTWTVFVLSCASIIYSPSRRGARGLISLDKNSIQLVVVRVGLFELQVCALMETTRYIHICMYIYALWLTTT